MQHTNLTITKYTWGLSCGAGEEEEEHQQEKEGRKEW
jgi:hypothetical protein